MTEQIPDEFRCNGEIYHIVGQTEPEIINLQHFGIQPNFAITACWRKYVAGFAVFDSQLVLDSLRVNLLHDDNVKLRREGTMINGILPTMPTESFDSFNNHYDKLRYPLSYTGGFLLAKGFLCEQEVPTEVFAWTGYLLAWEYSTVLELDFKNGMLRGAIDRSARVAEIRCRFADFREEDELQS